MDDTLTNTEKLLITFVTLFVGVLTFGALMLFERFKKIKRRINK